MRQSSPWLLLVASIHLFAGPARADNSGRGDDQTPAPGSAMKPTPSRALPIGLLAIGVPALVGGTIGVALDEDDDALRPTFLDSGPSGVVAAVVGGLFTAVGAYLYLDHSPSGPNAGRNVMQWTGAGVMAVSAAAAVLGIKYDFDRRQANRDYAELCSVDCRSPELQPIRAGGSDAEERRNIAFWASGTLAIGGIVLFLAGRERERGSPKVQVSATGASIGWSRSF